MSKQSNVHAKPIMTAALALIATLGLAAHAKADVILDQSNPATNAGFSGSHTWQQQIIAGMDGTLDSIDLYFVGSGSIDIAVYASAEPWQIGTPDFIGTVEVDGLGTYNVDLASADIPVLADESFVLELRATQDDISPQGSFTAGDYAGDLWIDSFDDGPFNFNDLGGPGWDLGFQTYVTTPAPGALAMLGLAGIGGVRRRRRG